MSIITSPWILSKPDVARRNLSGYRLTANSHHLLSLSLEGKLHLAPLKDDIQVRTLARDIYNKLLTGIVESPRYRDRDW
jgi:hypothetical protein